MPFINDKLNAYNQKDQPSSPLISNQSNPQASSLTTRFTFDVDPIIDKLKASIFGQDETIIQIENLLRVVHADITETTRPLYVALFLGPTGVGKTEMVRILAQSIYGSADNFCRVDMNTLAQEHYSAAITGAPPGYVGSKEGTTLLDEAKIKGSFSKPGIVLFDEIEKADPSVIQTLLNVFDNGQMVLTSGEHVIDFRNSMIFMTSNLGSRQIFEFADNDLKARIQRLKYKLKPSNWGKEDHLLLEKVVKEQLELTFTPEFLNRIDDTLVFNWLGKQSLTPILEKLLSDLNKRLIKHRCELRFTDSAKKLIIENGFDKHYGARALKRCVRKYVDIPLAKTLETSLLNKNEITTFLVSVEKNHLNFTKQELEE